MEVYGLGADTMASISKRASGAWQNTSYGIRGTATDTITTLPTTIYSDGTNATVSIKGNTIQNGAPTPENPVMPQGTGERAAQLIPYPFYSSDGEYAGVQFTTDNGRVIANGTLTSGLLYYLWRPAKFPAGTYTMSVKGKHSGATVYFRDVTNSVSVVSIYGAQEGYRSVTFTIAEEISAMVYINATSGTIDFDCTIMLNAGEEALPFEPFGVKIPILSADTTTNNYLGEVESTRQIQKLAFDGTETITEESTNVYSIPITDTVTTGTGLSTHFEYDSTVSAGQFRIEAGKVVFGYNDTLANFSTFLAAQYAAGTPVTIWYVLATPETAVVNEPLMKIEDYADVVNNISIPTTDGANTLSVDTTVQPSEVSVNYHGWHMGTVHERTAGQWD